MGSDKAAEKGQQIETGVEQALGRATDDEQTHSEDDQTGGAAEPPQRRDQNADQG